MRRALRLSALVCSVVLLAFFGRLHAAGHDTPARIIGIITDAQTDRPIGLANVIVEGSLLGDATDDLGRFEIGRVPPGSHTLEVRVIGYRSRSVDVMVGPGEELRLDISLERAPIEIAPIVVTASRREEDVLDVPVGLSVLTSREIAKRDVFTPDEALRHASGVVITESQASIRGSGGFNRGAGSRLLLLVDGVPALAGDTGDIKWDLIPPEEIQRIEIVKSASSSLYGSSGLGGVINVVTRPIGSSPRTGFRISCGYFDDPYYSEWKWTSEWLKFGGIDISHTRRIGNLGVAVAMGRKMSDGYRRNSDFDRSNAMAKISYDMGPTTSLTSLLAWALDKHGHSTEWKSQSEALDIDPAAWNDRIRSEKFAGFLKARSVLGLKSLLSATFNWYNTDWKNDFHDSQDDADATRLGGSLQLDRVAPHRWQSTVGLEAWRSRVASTMFGNRTIGELGVFGELRRSVRQDISVILGLRYDAHYLNETRGWESLISPRGAIVIRTGRVSSLNLSVGRGFRAPTIAEMFTHTAVGGFTVKPNLTLSAERGITYEAGWFGELRPWLRLSFGLFKSQYKQLIEPKVDPGDGSLQFTNIGQARIAGIESWLATVPIAGLISLTSSYMYLDAEDDRTGEPLAYRSRHNFKGSVEISRSLCTVGLDFRYRSRVERVEVYEADQRVPVRVVDLRGGVDLGTFTLSFKVANLLSYNYTEIERTLAPTRHLSITLRGRL